MNLYTNEELKRRAIDYIKTRDEHSPESFKRVTEVLEGIEAPTLGHLHPEIFRWIGDYHEHHGQYPDQEAIEYQLASYIGSTQRIRLDDGLQTLGDDEVTAVLEASDDEQPPPFGKDSLTDFLGQLERIRDCRAIQSAAERGDIGGVKGIVEALKPPITLEFSSVGEGRTKNNPLQPIIRGVKDSGIVLPAGEVGILTGPGGVGKSTLFSQWAITAAAHRGEDETGLHFAGGPVVIISWEESPAFIDYRLGVIKRRMGIESQIDPLLAINLEDHDALFEMYRDHGEERYRKTDLWKPLWEKVREVAPVLVVFDPSLEAYAGNANDIKGVRAFMRQLKHEANEIKCGILLIHHSNKADRDRKGPTAGAVLGSVAWTDRSRSVLELDFQVPQGEGEGSPANREDLVLLSLRKANFCERFEIGLTRKLCEVDSGRQPSGFVQRELQQSAEQAAQYEGTEADGVDERFFN